MTIAYAVATMSEACFLKCLSWTAFYVTLSTTSHKHVHHTRQFSSFVNSGILETYFSDHKIIWATLGKATEYPSCFICSEQCVFK